MTLIYTCPICGADLDEVILATYPPQYKRRCTNPKCGWSHIEDSEIVRIPYTIPEKICDVPACCRNCNNHPSNGGSGICHCVLPYMTNSGDVISYGTRC